jgi:hypothetical protein
MAPPPLPFTRSLSPIALRFIGGGLTRRPRRSHPPRLQSAGDGGHATAQRGKGVVNAARWRGGSGATRRDMAGGFGVTILSTDHRRSSAAPPAASRNSQAHGRSPGSRRIAGAAFPNFHQVQWREASARRSQSRGRPRIGARLTRVPFSPSGKIEGPCATLHSSFAEGCQISGTSRTLPGDETRVWPQSRHPMLGKSAGDRSRRRRLRRGGSGRHRKIASSRGLNLFKRSERGLLCALQAPQFDILGMRRADFRARLLSPDNSGAPRRRFRAANRRAAFLRARRERSGV